MRLCLACTRLSAYGVYHIQHIITTTTTTTNTRPLYIFSPWGITLRGESSSFIEISVVTALWANRNPMDRKNNFRFFFFRVINFPKILKCLIKWKKKDKFFATITRKRIFISLNLRVYIIYMFDVIQAQQCCLEDDKERSKSRVHWPRN